MNRNLKKSVWVLALGIAFTGLSTTGIAAAVPAQQGQDHDRNDHQYGDRGAFQQGLRDGQHDRQFGGNRDDHQQPNDASELQAYRDGYRQGFRNNPSNQDSYRTRNVNYFDQGLRDGQHDRQFGGNRDDHRQPDDANGLRAYQDGYRKGFRNN